METHKRGIGIQAAGDVISRMAARSDVVNADLISAYRDMPGRGNDPIPIYGGTPNEEQKRREVDSGSEGDIMAGINRWCR